jgi:MraZ protein
MRLARPFLSTFVNRIDAKGRVSVPAKFREILESQGARTIWARTSTAERAIVAGGPEWIAHLHSLVEEHDPSSEMHDDFAYSFLGDTVELSLDSEGRVMFPEMLLRHAGIEDSAAFIGVGNCFEVWEPKALDVRMLRARRATAERRGLLRAPKPNGGAGS